VSRTGDFAMRWRVRLGYPVAVIYLLFARPDEICIVAGSVIAFVGLCMRAAAAGHLRKHEQLAIGGPYARTRNPLYFGSALIAAGFLVAGCFWRNYGWVSAAIVAAYFGYFYGAVMKREARELRSRYGAEYEDYAARVPLFFPKLSDGGPPGHRFSWPQYMANREYLAALGVLAGIAALCVLLWIQRR
jgi:protein-S-isoprenylcysteine O-methyltransferase Ste14